MFPGLRRLEMRIAEFATTELASDDFRIVDQFARDVAGRRCFFVWPDSQAPMSF
jgi:hypothetical protein